MICRKYAYRPSLQLYRITIPVDIRGLADAEDVAVWMADVHFSDVPRHVGWRKGDVESGGVAGFVDLVNIVHEDGHPDALIPRFVTVWSKGGGVHALSTAALGSMAKENFAFA